MTNARALFLAWILTASCTGLSGTNRSGRSVREAYAAPNSRELRVREQPSPLRAQKGIPVLAPPEVFAVYVPTHVNRERDLMIGEHWVFLKLRDADWFVERERNNEPLSSGKTTTRDWERIAAIPEKQWGTVLIPSNDGIKQ